MRQLGWGLIVILGWMFFVGTPAHAETLRMQPLEYRTTLAAGDVQKGFVDIANPGRETVIVTTSVRAFRQIDDQGTLEFYDDAEVSAGITPDLDEFELAPNEIIRMYFIVDGSKLPSGDVFAGLFATAKAKDDTSGAQQVARVGTLLNIVNGTPGSRQADIVHLDVPFLQIGEQLVGSYVIKNRAEPTQATGFYPEVTLAVDPFHSQHVTTSKLIFAGRSRTNDFSVQESRLGLYNVSVTYGSSTKSQWVLMATGVWTWIGALLAIVGIVVLAFSFIRIYQRRKMHFKT